MQKRVGQRKKCEENMIRENKGIAERARAVKSTDELALMHVSMDACEAACDSMREALEPGSTENALWARMH